MAPVVNRSVLVLDGDKVHALDIVRCLGRAGLRVTVGASTPAAIAFRSRYTHARLIYPRPDEFPDRFVTWLAEALRATPFDLVVPVTDLTVVPLSMEAARFRGLSVVAAESWDNLEAVRDKDRTIALARSLDVPVPPASTTVSHAGQLTPLLSSLTFPVVTKPARSATWSTAGFHASPAMYAFDGAQLLQQVERLTPAGPVLIQQYIPGIGVGLEVLARDGQILQSFQHQRLHELPLTGGGSTYRMSVPVDPVLLEYGRRLMGALRWTGVAMIEFKTDRVTGRATLLEINGRFWGSLPLASRAGMRFATDLYRMLVLDETPAARPYAVGVRCRRLRDDVIWFTERMRLNPRDPLVLAGLIEPKSAAALCRDVTRLLSLRDRYDVQVLSDPLPGCVDGYRMAATWLAAARRRVAAPVRTAGLWWHRVVAARRLKRALPRAQRVLFVCYGNIMRSPFASGYAQRAHGVRSPLEVRSAGFHARGGRPADPRALEASKSWGVDLEAHRSTVLDDDLVDWADVVFVMDRANRRQVRKLFPRAAAKCYLIGVLENGRAVDVEIPDPFTADALAMQRACVRIAGAVDVLIGSVGVRATGVELRPEAQSSS